MERLTERTAVGILVKEDYGKEVLKTLYSCYGGKPNPHYTNCEEGYCAMEKLADYEDAEEHGLPLRWIPCSERLPDEAFGCLVTVMDCEPSTQTEFENILSYFVGYDGETWNDADGEEIPFEVIAWQKLPQPYQPKGE